MRIVWTRHAQERQLEWEKKRAISREVIESLLRRRGMRIRYDPESDVLLFVLRDNAPVDAVEEPGGVIISYGEDGQPVSVECLHAAARKLTEPGELSVTIQSGKTR